MNWIQSRSLFVNADIIQAVMSNPQVTCDDLESLIASVSNQMGMASHWVSILLDFEAEIVLRNYYGY